MGTSDTKIFDKDTLLDLTVNFVPLGILLFFTLYILLASPWSIGDDPLIMVITIGLHVVPFVSLAVLTYFSGKAIAGSEKEGEVYLAGRASVSSANPLEAEHEGEADEDHDEIGEPDAEARAVAEGEDEGAAEDEDAVEDEAVTSDDEDETDPEPGAGTRDATDGVDDAEDGTGNENDER